MRAWLKRIRWGAAPIIIVSLVLATLAVEMSNPQDKHEHPIPTAMGSWGRVSKAVEFRVNDVRVGSTLANGKGQPERISQGQFVVVNVSLRTDQATNGSLSVTVRTRDNTEHRAGTARYEAGFVVTSDMAFELPQDQLEGAVITARESRAVIALERLVVVDLGLTRDKVAALPRYQTVALGEDSKEAYR